MTCPHGFAAADVKFAHLTGKLDAHYVMLIVSDGFQQDEEWRFDEACSSLVYRITNEPWYRMHLSPGGSADSIGERNLSIWKAFIRAELSDEFMSVPAGKGYPDGPRTLFGTRLEDYGTDGGVEWLHTSRDECVDAVYDLFVDTVKRSPDSMAILVNYDVPAGKAHGAVAMSTTASMFEDLMLHELGHVWGLRDEYPGDPTVEPGDSDTTVTNIQALNVSSNEVTPPWSAFSWFFHAVRYPADCASGPNEYHEPWDYLAVFEGACGYHCGVFRSSAQCRMRTYPTPFCLVCTYVIMCELELPLPELIPG